VTPKPVGILGGMGPGATVDFMARVIALTEASDDADHVPLIVDQNPAVPSRIAHLIERTGPDPTPVLEAMARRLVAQGCVALAMPCNTAHAYKAAIAAAADPVPFLDMVALAAEAAGPGAVGILCSPATRLAGVFDGPLAAVGARAVYLADDAPLLALIRAVKKDGVTPEAREGLRRASDQLLAEGAVTQLIACTEFSMLGLAAPDRRLIDTADVLARAVIRAAGGRLVSEAG